MSEAAINDSYFWNDIGRKTIAVQRYCSSVQKDCKTDRCLINEIRKDNILNNSYVDQCDFKSEKYPLRHMEDAFEKIRNSNFDLEEVKQTIIEMEEVLEEQEKKPKRHDDYFEYRNSLIMRRY